MLALPLPQTSLSAGTLFEHTKLPLSTWFLAKSLLTQTKTGISALALRRQLGISYRSAWLMKHRLMYQMAKREAARQLEKNADLFFRLRWQWFISWRLQSRKPSMRSGRVVWASVFHLLLSC
ncbi:MAG: hypothetical protein ACK4E7_13080 [Permianibacter sp.]